VNYAKLNVLLRWYLSQDIDLYTIIFPALRVKPGGRKFIKLNAAILKSSKEEPIGGVISFRDLSVIEKIIKDSHNSVSFGGIIGRSKSMREIFELIKEISESDATVLNTRGIRYW
jgi:hypothetical protein